MLSHDRLPGNPLIDLRFSTRMATRALRASPLVTILAVLCIGLGIGSFTTVYSTATAFTFHPLPQLGDPERLLLIADVPANALTRGSTVAPGTFADLTALPELDAAAAFTSFVANIVGDDLPERADGVRVSTQFFRVAGRAPVLGRVFLSEETVPGADRVVILSHGLWQRRFGGDPAVVGRTVRINGEGWTVVGVMPEDFVFPAGTQLWAPLAMSSAQAADRSNRNLLVMARLAPGVSAERGRLAIRALGRQLDVAWPGVYTDRTLHSRRAEELFGEGPRPFMIVLLSAVAFLLLIACANVANLLLARATARQRESGVRVALGASRARLIGERLAESLILAVLGGALGVLIAWWGVHATATTVPLDVQQYLPGFGAIRLDLRALLVAAVVSMSSGLLFGIVPAFAAARVDVVTSLKDAGRGESRRSGLRHLRNALVVGEISLALMLVTGAALMVTTFRRISVSYPGFRTERVLTGRVTLPEGDYTSDSAVVRFWDRVRDAAAAIPGVEAAELTTVLPMTWNEQRASFHVDGEPPLRPESVPSAGIRRVTPGYFAALDIAVQSGRGFQGSDAQDAPAVVVISESAARRYFPRGDAVGRRMVSRDRVMEVVGIVRDVRANPLTSNEPLDVVYAPLSQWTARTVSLVLRTRQDPSSVTPPLQAAVARQDARLAVGEVSTMEGVVRTVTSPQSATAQMLLVSAIVALVMAIVGTYGVMTYVVGRRTHELGVRVALGASRRTIVWLVIASVSRLVLAGVIIGTVGALALGRGMQAILFDTSPSDPVVIGGAAALLAASALLAGYLPARRAAGVSPMLALRSD